jgi:hypothetical protein
VLTAGASESAPRQVAEQKSVTAAVEAMVAEEVERV